MLTLSGLFSVLSFIVEQRAKDIGVRMALGANGTSNVAAWCCRNRFAPVGIGLVAGGGLAAALAIGVMATPMAAEIGNLVHLFDPVAVRCEPAGDRHLVRSRCVGSALRAARIDPIATLRKDRQAFSTARIT